MLRFYEAILVPASVFIVDCIIDYPHSASKMTEI